MFRWLLVFVLAMALIGGFTSFLKRIGLGRLPGDLNFRLRNKEYSFPFMSSLLLSAVMTGLFYFIH
ncbi:MAG: DUF2905 domain-containing protein [Betaproteobacteria bacterium]|nr:DUF2905 domain-containing protein [Betaproteobacteria bacterium]